MESSLVIELKIACVDIGYFCWTNPCRKFSNLIWESLEMNSHRRWIKACDELQQLCAKEGTTHFSSKEELKEWIYVVPVYGFVWTYQTTTPDMEQREMRRVPQKGSTIEALTRRRQPNISRTQARRLMRSRVQLTSYQLIWCLLSSSSKRPTRTLTTRTRMTRATTSWHASSYHQTSKINGGLSTVSRKATTMVTRQHPKVVEDEASMQVPMRFFPWQ
jgi:hypothetical protein